MIPKQLFFVWLGDNIPKYADFSINSFRKVNPDFKIDLVHFSDEDCEMSKKYEGKILEILQKKYIDKCLNAFNDLSGINRYKGNENYYKVKLSECIRFGLLNKYGGIYLDCDTFPIKPFDDELLKLNYFSAVWKNSMDLFFFGKEKNTKQKVILLKTSSMYESGLLKNKEYMDLCHKFYNFELKYGESFNDCKEHYIDHYWIRAFKYKE